MISWTLQIAFIWLAAGIFFGWQRTNRAFISVTWTEKEFSFRIGPAMVVYVIGLIALAAS